MDGNVANYMVGFGVAVIAIKELTLIIREIVKRKNGTGNGITLQHHEDMAKQREEMAKMRHDEMMRIQKDILIEIKGMREDIRRMGGWYDYIKPGT